MFVKKAFDNKVFVKESRFLNNKRQQRGDAGVVVAACSCSRVAALYAYPIAG